MTPETPTNHLDKVEARWFAVRTRFKCEKLVHKQLSNKGLNANVPLQSVARRYTRKIKVYDIPLISCYIFVKIVKDDYVKVLETENVAGFVRFAKQLISIPEEEMNILKLIAGEALELEARPMENLAEGDEVEIISGNLVGMKGLLVETHGKNKVIIALENIGYELHLNIDIKHIRRIKAKRLAIS